MFTVASYNMHKGVGLDRVRRPDRTIDVLNEVDADIVALQEADRRFGARVSAIPIEMLERHSDYRHVPLGLGPDSLGWHGNALLVKREVEVLTHDRIALPTLEPRGAVLAEVRIAGVRVRVVGMHLDLSGLWRKRQARAICDALDTRRPLPTVLMGDLNEWRNMSGCLSTFDRQFVMAPTGASFHARRPVGKLDRIMVDPSLAFDAAGVHHSARARTASDHLPIWARVLTNEGSTRPQRRRD